MSRDTRVRLPVTIERVNVLHDAREPTGKRAQAAAHVENPSTVRGQAGEQPVVIVRVAIPPLPHDTPIHHFCRSEIRRLGSV